MSRSISSLIKPSKPRFLMGQLIPHSMTRQIKAVGLYIDDKSLYEPNGVIVLFAMKQEEKLLLKTSGTFVNPDKAKVNFDHHRGVYGLLSMVKYISDDY